METSVILIVEDDPDEQLLLQMAFRRAGVLNPLHIVADGEEAVDYLSGAGPYSEREQFPLPGLIVSDYEMPGLDGIKLTRWIRMQQELCQIPVVVLIGSGWDQEIERAYEEGAELATFKSSDYLGLVEEIMGVWQRSLQNRRLG